MANTANVLLVGGAGYIGKEVLRYLQDRGVRVYSFDRKLGDEAASPEQVEAALDCMDKPTHIIHLAAVPGVVKCLEDPLMSFSDNVLTTLVIATVASRRGIPVLFASSTA